MTPVEQVGMLVVNTFINLYLLVVILRFLLQVVRADFYNPLSQFIVKATNPLLVPMRKAIPGFGGIDIASLVLAILVQALGLSLIMMIKGAMPVPEILLWSVINIIAFVLNIYFFGLLISIIASWVAPGSYNPALILINQILEPVTRPIRKMLPDMGGLDISPIIVFLLIQVLSIVHIAIAQSAKMPEIFYIGVGF